MLSGGNPTGGANPTGIGKTINYIGNHAYAYSGLIGIDDGAPVMLDFTTGNSYITATFDYGNSTTSGAPAALASMIQASGCQLL